MVPTPIGMFLFSCKNQIWLNFLFYSLVHGIKDPLPTSQAGFFKFMFVLHIFTLLTEILLLLGGMFKMEGLLAIWLAWPTGFSYIYSAVYSNLAYTDFWELGMKRSNDSALAFTMIGLMLYLSE